MKTLSEPQTMPGADQTILALEAAHDALMALDAALKDVDRNLPALVSEQTHRTLFNLRVNLCRWGCALGSDALITSPDADRVML